MPAIVFERVAAFFFLEATPTVSMNRTRPRLRPTLTLTRPQEATETHGNKRLRLGFEHQTCYGL